MRVPSHAVVRVLLAVALVPAIAAAPAASAKDRRADVRTAQAGLLIATDVGTSWVSELADRGTGFGPKEVVECRRVTRATHRGRRAFEQSPRFTRNEASVSTSVSVYRSRSSAEVALRAIGGSDAQSCISTILQRQLRDAGAGSGSTAIAVSIVSTAPPLLGDSATAYLVDAEGATATGRTGVAAMLVAIRVGRANLAATFAATEVPDLETATRVLTAPVDRLVRAQA